MASSSSNLFIDTHLTTVSAPTFLDHRLKWTLEFSQLPADTDIFSPDIETTPPFKWHLVFAKCDNAPYLYFVNDASSEMSLDFEVSLYTSDEQSVHTETKTGVKCPNQEKVDIIPNYDDTANNVNIDTLVMICNFKLTSVTTTLIRKTPASRNKSLKQYSDQNQFSTDLKSLLKKQLHADVFLVAEGTQVPCHKCILCVRSPVFEKMFQHEQEGRTQNTVQIEDIKLPALKKLVAFIYGGTVDAEDDIEKTYDLYYAAEKYKVLQLSSMCVDTLVCQLSVDNATQVLLWADRHKDVRLKDAFNDFVEKNFGAISNTQAWCEFVTSETKLAAETLKHYTTCVAKMKQI